MFQKLRAYTHRNMLDCAISVLKSYRMPDGRYKLKVQWFLKRGFDLALKETLIISRKQIPNWVRLDQSKM